MEQKIWTYETLAQASPAEIEEMLSNCMPPEYDKLEGYIYCGWNHEWIPSVISGRKFKKGFMVRDGQNMGYNETVIQDKTGCMGPWNQRIMATTGKPNQMGYFYFSFVKDQPYIKLFKPYMNTSYFHYDVPHMEKWYHFFFRVVIDFVVLPNKDDHSLLMCKTYLRIFSTFNIFYAYFQLGRREKIQYPPW